MKFVEILLKKLEEKGIKQAELVIVEGYKAVSETLSAVSADTTASATEKMVCGIMQPIVAGFAPAIDKLADLNKDGQIG